MRQALAGRRGPRGGAAPKRVSQSTTLPPPVEGLDTETPVAELPLTRAIVLDNWIPKGVALEMRKGYADHVTGGSAAAEALLVYNAGLTQRLFACIGTAIYDVTTAGALGAASLSSGVTSARWKGVNIQTSGGNFLWICNGVDDPRHWNGTTWATPSLTITTYTDNDISYVCESKQRLFFVFKNTLVFGYLPVDSIAGTVSNFSLGSVFGRGGRLIAIGTFTNDGGSGPDDYTAFLTSEGEVAIYAGVNPGSASEWSLVGRWFVGMPKGDTPLIDLDGDLGVITVNGVVPIAQVFSGHEVTEPPRYLTARISTLFRDQAATGNEDGWSGIYHPAGDLLIINAPVSSTISYQFVRHQITGGWTRFTGWDAACFAVFNGELYFGGWDGDIYLCDSGYDDDGEDITATLQTAWTSLGTRGALKRLNMARPVVTTSTGAAVSLVARADYQSTPPVPAFPTSTLTGALVWGTGLWGTGLWGGQDLGTRQWRSVSSLGHTVSIVLKAQSRQSRFALNGIDIIYEMGGPL
jgi:hypothetical protein